MEVFVYGTLTDSDTAAAVLDDLAYRGEARLDGLHRVAGRYPTLLPGGTVDGRLLVTDDVDALDRYEGVDRGLYVRVTVPTATSGTVETYVGDPAKLDVENSWPGSGPFERRVRSYLTDRPVLVRKL